MKLTIESTGKIATINDGVDARIWNGVSEGGVKCLVFVTRIAVPDGQTSEFDRELKEQPHTKFQIGGMRGPIDLRLIV